MNPIIARLTKTCLTPPNILHCYPPINLFIGHMLRRAVLVIVTNFTLVGRRSKVKFFNAGSTICYIDGWPLLPGEKEPYENKDDLFLFEQNFIITWANPADANNKLYLQEYILQEIYLYDANQN